MYYVFYIIKHLALSSFAHRGSARQLAETDEIQVKTSSPCNISYLCFVHCGGVRQLAKVHKNYIIKSLSSYIFLDHYRLMAQVMNYNGEEII
jgi:hypothetical protein